MTELTADPTAAVVLFLGIQLGCVVAALMLCAIVHDHWRPNWRGWLFFSTRLAVVVISAALTSQSQQPGWAQEQRRIDDRVRAAENDITELKSSLRQNTRDITKTEGRLDGHDQRIRTTELAIERGNTMVILIAVLAPPVFQVMLWGIGLINTRRNGRNGHSLGGQGK